MIIISLARPSASSIRCCPREIAASVRPPPLRWSTRTRRVSAMEPVDADASCSMWLWESDPDQSTLAVGCTAAFGLSAETGVGWRRRRVPGAAAAATVSDIDRKGRVARCRPESRGRGQLVLGKIGRTIGTIGHFDNVSFFACNRRDLSLRSLILLC